MNLIVFLLSCVNAYSFVIRHARFVKTVSDSNTQRWTMNNENQRMIVGDVSDNDISDEAMLDFVIAFENEIRNAVANISSFIENPSDKNLAYSSTKDAIPEKKWLMVPQVFEMEDVNEYTYEEINNKNKNIKQYDATHKVMDNKETMRRFYKEIESNPLHPYTEYASSKTAMWSGYYRPLTSLETIDDKENVLNKLDLYYQKKEFLDELVDSHYLGSVDKIMDLFSFLDKEDDDNLLSSGGLFRDWDFTM